VDAAHVVDGQGPSYQLPLHQVLESIIKAQHFVAVVDGFNGGRVNHAVDARSRAASYQNSNLAFGCFLRHMRNVHVILHPV